MYDKPNNENFQNKVEQVQYRACLTITNAIRGTSRERLYDELGLHSLIERRWRSKLIFFYKIMKGLLPEYLFSYLDFSTQEKYSLRLSTTSMIKPFPSKKKFFKNTFFPYCISEWNKLTVEIKNAKSINIFKKLILIKKKENSIFSICDPLGVKLLTRLRLNFSHLNEHKFRHVLTTRSIHYVPAEMTLRPRSIFSCEAINILPKEKNSLKSLKNFIQIYQL